MEQRRKAMYRVFISHAMADTWVARQIAAHVEQAGASTFLDVVDIHGGDIIEDQIAEALENADEHLVLMTPAAVERM